MAIRIEYDDGKLSGECVPQATPRGRQRGFYAILPDGREMRIPISFMKVGEIAAMEKFLREME